jgi:predicted ABC-type transport system involved in lysophospholipase L1 biosynthesis ATPase subunit
MTVLVAEAARITRGSSVLLSDFSIRTTTDRVALVGDWSALFELAFGHAELAGGRLELVGQDFRQGMREGRVGWAPRALRWPEEWTTLEFLTQSARLFGRERARAEQTAQSALAALGVPYLTTCRYTILTEPQRRVVALARAALSEPELIVAEGPFDGLSPAYDEFILAALQRAGGGRRLLVSFEARERHGVPHAWLAPPTEIVEAPAKGT